MPRIGQMTNKKLTSASTVMPWTLSGVTYIGIDPGASGGVSFISPMSSKEGPILSTFKMPDTEADLWNLIKNHSSSVQFAVVEQLTGFVGKAIPSHTMFKLGTNYGMTRMALTAARIPYELAVAQKWQKALGIPRRDKKESSTEWKNRLKSFAQRLFPGVSVTLATSDSILIAEYARRLKEGKL